MKRKYLWTVIVALIVLLAFLIFSTIRTQTNKSETIIKVGAILPLTGDAAPYGNNTKEGILVALKKSNDLLKANRKRIEVVFEDTRANPKDGVSATQKLIDVDRVVAIIDDSVSGVTLAAVPICDRKQVVLLSTGATSPKLSGISKYFFRIWNSDAEEGRFMSEYLTRELKPSKVAILYINNEYGEGLRDVFSKSLAATGVQIVAMESHSQGVTDLRAQLNKIKATSPQYVYLVTYPKEAKFALKQARELGLETTWLGTVVMLEAEMPVILKRYSYKMYFPTPNQPDANSSSWTEFQKAFQEEYKKAPPVLADVGYDAMMLIAGALNASAADGSQIADFLRSQSAVEMASGRIAFDSNGDVHKPMQIKTLP